VNIIKCDVMNADLSLRDSDECISFHVLYNDGSL